MLLAVVLEHQLFGQREPQILFLQPEFVDDLLFDRWVLIEQVVRPSAGPVPDQIEQHQQLEQHQQRQRRLLHVELQRRQPMHQFVALFLETRKDILESASFTV